MEDFRMQRLLALTLLAGFALAGAPSVRAATPPHSTLVITYSLDYTRDESDRPGASLGIHAVAVTHMQQTWTGTRFACRFDPYTVHLIVNGQALARPMPAASCTAPQNTGQIFGSIDFAHFPTHPST